MTDAPRNSITEDLPTVDLYFDFVSPYAYLAWAALRRLQQQRPLDLQPRPVLFAGLLRAHGTLGPAEVPAKRHFVFYDSLRKARLLDIPLEAPFGHPFNPLLPLRLSLAVSGGLRCQLIDHLYQACWQHSVNVADAEALRAHLETSEIDCDFDELFTAAEQPAVKSSLREATDEAVSREVFGVPTFFHLGERYWGVDNLDALVAGLDGRVLVTAEDHDRWSKVQPLAQRRR